MIFQPTSFPHFWALPLCCMELAQPHGLNLTDSLLKNICTYLPGFEAQRCLFFNFFFGSFCSGRGQSVAFNKNLSNILFFFSFVIFLCFLSKQGKKQTTQHTSSGSGREIITLNVQSRVCLEMNIQGNCCISKAPQVAGLI